MRVNPGRRREHCAFGLEADDPQPPHAAPLRSCIGETLEIGLDSCGAAAKRTSIHVIMTAGVDVAHEPRLRPGFQFHDKASGGAGADGSDIAGYLRLARKSPLHASRQRGGHDLVLPEMNRPLSSRQTPSMPLTRTSPAPA